MLSVILTAITIFFVIWWIYVTWQSDYFYTIIGRLFVTVLELAAGGIIWLLVALMIPWGIANMVTEYTFKDDSESDLVAIRTSDSIEGEFSGSIFASYGYIEGKRVLSYITEDEDGGMRLGYVDVDSAVVYEGDDDPRIVTHNWIKENGWFLLGGEFASGKTYSIFVPEGSVVQDYEISP